MADRTTYPVLPLRDIVVFPHMIVPLFVGREKSIHALEEVMRADKQILLATQQNPSEDEPSPATIYSVGTLATVLQLLKLPDGTVKVLVEGVGRAEITGFTDNEAYYEANGQDSTAQFRYTVNFIRRDGQLKIAAIHMTQKH